MQYAADLLHQQAQAQQQHEAPAQESQAAASPGAKPSEAGAGASPATGADAPSTHHISTTAASHSSLLATQARTSKSPVDAASAPFNTSSPPQQPSHPFLQTGHDIPGVAQQQQQQQVTYPALPPRSAALPLAAQAALAHASVAKSTSQPEASNSQDIIASDRTPASTLPIALARAQPAEPGLEVGLVHDNVITAGISRREAQEAEPAAGMALEGAQAVQVQERKSVGHAEQGQPSPEAQPQTQAQAPKHVMRERRVPESPFSRALGFAGLGASLLLGTMGDSLQRVWSGPQQVAGTGPGACWLCMHT